MFRLFRRSSPCLAAACLILMGANGCVWSRKQVQRAAASHLADTGTSYNLAIEQAQNEMLLLNVIRAMEHRPMYLTDASKVTGTVKLDVSLGLKLAKADYTGSPSIDYSSSPAMDVNLLDAQDFMDGFLAPVPQQLFAYYWDQGWPSELLLYLLVLRVDVYQEDVSAVKAKPDDAKQDDEYALSWSLKCSVSNHPEASDVGLTKLVEFADLIAGQVVNGRPKLHSKEALDAAVGPLVTVTKFADLVSVAQSDGLLLERKSDKPPTDKPPYIYQLKQPKTLYTLVPVKAPPDYTCPSAGTADSSAVSWHALTERMPDQIMMRAPGRHTAYALKLRSPEGMLYYLGQLARLGSAAVDEAVATNDPATSKPKGPRRVVMMHACDADQGCEAGNNAPMVPLFVAMERRLGCRDGIIEVRAADGGIYLIPKDDPAAPQAVAGKLAHLGCLYFKNAQEVCSSGRSMMAFNLASQLIGLQKTAADFSTTSTVKLVGQ
jgi:hypothetical protein